MMINITLQLIPILLEEQNMLAPVWDIEFSFLNEFNQIYKIVIRLWRQHPEISCIQLSFTTLLCWLYNLRHKICVRAAFTFL